MMWENTYCIHGIDVHFVTDSPAIVEAAGTLLRYFQHSLAPAPPAVTLRVWAVDERSQIPVVISDTAQTLFSRTARTAGDQLRSIWQCTLYRDHGRFIADFHEQGLFLVDNQSSSGEGYFIKPEAMHVDARACYLHFILAEMLKGLGLHTIHATALEKNGRGVLIPGASGRGKTTSFISLLRSGYRYLSDDHPLVHESESDFEVLSFPVKVDVTEKTMAFFPELNAVGAPLHRGIHKHYFYVEDLYQQGPADACRPAVILFPHVVDWPKSTLEPLPKSRALEGLLPEALFVFDKAIAKKQLDLFSRLVQQADCYRLYFGSDILDLPQLIDPLLEAQ